MEISLPSFIPLLILTFLVALIYSSVGHGGASGYLALLSWYSFPKEAASSTALCLNLLVSGMALGAFWKANFFSWRFSWPFIVLSVPSAFLGGFAEVSSSLHMTLLALALAFAGLRLLLNLQDFEEKAIARPSLLISLPLGAFIGALSGIVGVGGGIFLSPVILLLGWAGPKRTAAASAFFILINSFAGLLGRMFRNHFNFEISTSFVMLVALAFIGGVAGSNLGANRFAGIWLRRILAFGLFVAALKIFQP